MAKSQASSSTRSSKVRSTTREPNDTDISAKDFVESYTKRTTRNEEEDLALRSIIVPKLAKRAYHLEKDNTWFEDWKQYQKNTHPVFGICLHHPLHPVRLPQRIIILVGSIAFGFALTNCVYLGFLGKEEAGDAVNYIYEITGKVADYQQNYTNIELEQTMVFLVTVGSFIHSAFDMLIWYMMACFCFRPGGHFKTNKLCQNFGVYSGVALVVLSVVAATSVMIVRLDNDETQNPDAESSAAEKFAEDNILSEGTDGDTDSSNSKQFSFLVGYALELVFALFVFYFTTSTVFFSGILGCGRIPILGGRPYEVRKEKANADNDQSENDVEIGMCMEAYNI